MRRPFMATDLLCQRELPARRRCHALQLHPTADARQDPLPVLWAQGCQHRTKTEIIGCEIGSFLPFETKLRELGRNERNGCVRHAEPLSAKSMMQLLRTVCLAAETFSSGNSYRSSRILGKPKRGLPTSDD